MKIDLLDIPGLTDADQSCWKIRLLSIDGKSPALEALVEWERSEKADFKKILKVMRIVGQMQRVANEKHVRKSSNKNHEGAYEMRADKGRARLMFFYDEESRIVICTNSFLKGKGTQDAAFGNCSELRQIYLRQDHEKNE